MEYGLFTCGYQRTKLSKAFADAKAFGYSYVELWGGRPHAYAPDLVKEDSRQLREIRGCMEQYEIPVLIYTPEHNAYPYNYMQGDGQQWEESIAYLKTAMDAAALLGAPYMLISVGHGGDIPYAKRWERLKESLVILAGEAQKRQITLLLETLTKYESNTCITLSELQRILTEVNSDSLRGMCDLAAPFTCGENPADYMKLPGGGCYHLHLVDNDKKSDTHLIPGEGCMPLQEILTGFERAGYNGRATIELVTNYMDNPSAAFERAIQNMSNIFPNDVRKPER